MCWASFPQLPYVSTAIGMHIHPNSRHFGSLAACFLVAADRSELLHLQFYLSLSRRLEWGEKWLWCLGQQVGLSPNPPQGHQLDGSDWCHDTYHVLLPPWQTGVPCDINLQWCHAIFYVWWLCHLHVTGHSMVTKGVKSDPWTKWAHWGNWSVQTQPPSDSSLEFRWV